MRNDSQEREQGLLRRATETALDVAIGGSALAADKAIETLDRVAGRGEEILRSRSQAAQEKLAEATDSARERLSDAAATARKAVADPDTRPYEERSRDELYELAAERDIDGRSNMLKDELIAALREQR